MAPTVKGLPGFKEKVFVFRKKDKSLLELSVRRCRQNELHTILDLQQLVYDRVTNKDTFVRSTKDELSESLISDICIGVFHRGRLVAFTLMVVNRLSQRNLACILGYDEQICRSSVTYDTTFVDPEYTGYGLQRFLSDLRERYAIGLGATAAYATVSPDNAISLKNISSKGFQIIDKKTMYGSYYRYILRKSLVCTK